MADDPRIVEIDRQIRDLRLARGALVQDQMAARLWTRIQRRALRAVTAPADWCRKRGQPWGSCQACRIRITPGAQRCRPCREGRT